MEEAKPDVKDVSKYLAWGKIREFSSSKGTKRERKWVIESTDLPEKLVEKIVALMPFPSIFKARCLSKSWPERFSPVTSKDDEAKKILKTYFQKQVCQRSNNWGTFCPVRFHVENVFACNLASHQCESMPSLIRNFFWGTPNGDLQLDGALLYGFTPSKDNVFVVTNILTRRHMQLPCGPNKRTVLGKKFVSSASLGTYKVILFCKEEYVYHSYSARIYSSKSNKWSSKKLVIRRPFHNLITDLDLIFEGVVCFNGVLYMVAPGDAQNLLAFNVDDKTSKHIRLSFIKTPDLTGYRAGLLPPGFVCARLPSLVVCRGNLLMITGPHFGQQCLPLHVFKIDLRSLQLLQVVEGPHRTGRKSWQ